LSFVNRDFIFLPFREGHIVNASSTCQFVLARPAAGQRAAQIRPKNNVSHSRLSDPFTLAREEWILCETSSSWMDRTQFSSFTNQLACLVYILAKPLLVELVTIRAQGAARPSVLHSF
jgi:hypothetical protein